MDNSIVGRQTVEITEQIRRASDIVDVVSAYVTLKRAGRQWRGLCPFHNEKTPSFHVNPERQAFKCFGCGAGGDVFKFIQLRENVPFPDARKILAARAGIRIDVANERSAAPGQTNKADLERLNRWACLWFQQQLAAPAGNAAREYVFQRGISEQSIQQFALGYAPDSWNAFCNAAAQKGIPTELLLAAGLVKRRDDNSGCYDAFRNRLIFPIRDALDRTIGFGGRSLGDDPAKYINSPQSALFDKSRCLYGLSTAKDAFRQSRQAIVVEGYVDCLIAQQFGFPNTVATLGTALTLEHVHMLRRYVDEVILLFDADSAGQRAMEQSLPLFFTADIDLRLAQVPEGKDPADLLTQKGPEALRNALTEATGALESKWKQVLRRCQGDARGPEIHRAVEEFLSLVVQSVGVGTCDPIHRGLLVNQVGKLLGLTGEEVSRQMRLLARRQAAPAGPRAGVEQTAPPPPSAAESAMKELLEVLLNEPGYYEAASSQFDPALCADHELRQIADAVQQMASRQGEFSLSALISQFESVEIARRIVDLQIAGETGGNFQARVDGAVATLRRVHERNRVSSMFAEIRRAPSAVGLEQKQSGCDATGIASEEEESVCRAAGEAARRISHFAARKHLSATPLIAGAAAREA